MSFAHLDTAVKNDMELDVLYAGRCLLREFCYTEHMHQEVMRALSIRIRNLCVH